MRDSLDVSRTPSTDMMTPSQRSATMARIRSKNTKPEIEVRKMLHAAEYRFRLHGSVTENYLTRLKKQYPDVAFRGKRLPGSPDIVFSAREKVINVNGCFWHSHTCKSGKVTPKANATFWEEKRLKTRRRDTRNSELLRAIGWLELTIWECELSDLESVAQRIIEFLGPPAYSPILRVGSNQ